MTISDHDEATCDGDREILDLQAEGANSYAQFIAEQLIAHEGHQVSFGKLVRGGDLPSFTSPDFKAAYAALPAIGAHITCDDCEEVLFGFDGPLGVTANA